MLAPGEEERLAALDWRGREVDLVAATTVVTAALPGGGQARRLARRDDGACVYLGADSLCRIHRHFGGETKPLMCRTFPFGFYAVAGRVAVDCSFSCRAVAADTGAPVAAHEPEWAALLAEAPPAAAEGHRLTRERAMTPTVLWELEQHLLALLSNAELPLLDRVRCCAQLVRLAAGGGDPATPAAALLRAALARGLPRQIAATARTSGMDRTQRAVFLQWLFLALDPVPAGFDQLAPAQQRAEERRRLAAAERFLRREGAPWVDNRDLATDWEAIAAVDLGALLAGPATPLLVRWLQAKVVGQRFRFAGEAELPLAEAVPLFLLAFPMALWTSAALAADRGAAAAGEEDARRAIALLDRTLGRLPLDALPGKVQKAWRFVLEETDLVVAAIDEVVGHEEPEEVGAGRV